jgi:hypothetical protein
MAEASAEGAGDMTLATRGERSYRPVMLDQLERVSRLGGAEDANA